MKKGVKYYGEKTNNNDIIFFRFCVGDRFYLCENKILCEYDYEERLVFASIGNYPMMKRHANNMSAASQQHPAGGPNSHHGVIHQNGGNNSQPVSPAFNSKMDDPNNNNNNNNNLTKSSNLHLHGPLSSGGSMF